VARRLVDRRARAEEWEFQSGPLKGLGFGIGGRYVGERMIDLRNTLELPDYAVLDARSSTAGGRCAPRST